MPKKSIPLTKIQVKILLGDSDLYNQYLEIQQALLSLLVSLNSKEWDPKILETLFPNKDGYQILVHENGTLSYDPISISELRENVKDRGLDSHPENLTRKELIELLKFPPTKLVDGKITQDIVIPKIGK